MFNTVLVSLCKIFSMILSITPCSRELPAGGVAWQKCLHICLSLHACVAPSTPLTPNPHPLFLILIHCSTFSSHDTGGLPLPSSFSSTLILFIFCSLLRHSSHIPVPSNCVSLHPIPPLHCLCILLSHSFQNVHTLHHSSLCPLVSPQQQLVR